MRNFKTTVEAAKALAAEYNQARSKAAVTDQDLRPEVAEDRASRAASDAAVQFAPRWDDLMAQARTEAERVRAAGASARPDAGLNDAAALTRQGQAWQFGVLPALQAGRPLVEVLATADADTVAAVERFAPTHLAVASRGRSLGEAVLGVEGPDPAGQVARLAAEAWARLVPDAADALLSAAVVEAEFAAVMSAVEAYRRGDNLGATLALAYADPYGTGPSSSAVSEGAPAA